MGLFDSKAVEEIEVRADTGQAAASMGNLEKSMTAAFAKATIAVDAAKAAAGFLWDSFKEGVQEAAKLERANLSMTAAIKAYGLDVASTSKVLDAQAASLGRLSGVGELHVKQLQAQALHYGIHEQRVDDVIRASISLANTTGKDVHQAFEQLTKSLSGNADETLRMIPGVSSLTAEQLKQGDAINTVNARLQENLDLMTKGGSGAATSVVQAWHEFNSALGESLLKVPLVEKGLSGLSGYLRMIADIAKRGGIGEALSAATLGVFDPQSWHDFEKGVVAESAGGGPIKATDAPFKRKTGDGPLGVSGQIAQLQNGGKLGDELVSFRGGFMSQSEKTGIIGREVDIDEQITNLAGPSISLGEDMVLFGGQWMTQGNADRKAELSLKLQERIDEGLNEIHAANETRRNEIAESGARQREKQEHDELNRTKAFNMRMVDLGAHAAGTMSSMAVDALQAWAEGQEVYGAQILNQFMWMMGKQLTTMAVVDFFRGAGMVAFGINVPQGMELMALSAAEAAAGAAMLGTAAAMTKNHIGTEALDAKKARAAEIEANKAARGSGGGSRGSYGGASGSSFSSGPGGGSAGSQPMVIQFYGPTTAPEVGLAIQRALGAAKAMGYT